MTCKNCGYEIPDDKNHCIHCGKDRDYDPNHKKKKGKKTAGKVIIGVIISLGLYIVSRVLASLVNTLIAFAVGYNSYNAFSSSESYGYMLLVVISGIVFHVFFSWLTTIILGAFTRKTHCLTYNIYWISAVAVTMYGIIIVAILFGQSAGWLTYTVHSAGLLLFGRHQLRKTLKQARLEENTAPVESKVNTPIESISDVISQFEERIDKGNRTGEKEQADKSKETKAETFNFCHKCGAKLIDNVNFCHKCGAKISR